MRSSSPVMLATRKDGTICFCVDNRRLKALTENFVYIIQRTDERVHTSGESMILTVHDALSGFWKVPLAK